MAYSSDSGSGRGFIPAQNTEEKLLQRRVADMVKAVSATGRARFTAFLSDREQALCTAQLNKQGWQGFAFWGGYESAERKMLCVFEGLEGEYPLEPLVLQAGGEGLTHRDYLGALMGLGLKRECAGDIVVNGREAVLYLQDSIHGLVLEELREVGRYSVVPMAVPEAVVSATPGGGEAQTATVASLRLDAVLAAMLRTSRGQAALRIKRGGVQVNHIEVTQPDWRVCEGDVFSLRGVGKYRLEEVGGQSRKNRIFIQYLKY